MDGCRRLPIFGLMFRWLRLPQLRGALLGGAPGPRRVFGRFVAPGILDPTRISHVLGPVAVRGIVERQDFEGSSSYGSSPPSGASGGSRQRARRRGSVASSLGGEDGDDWSSESLIRVAPPCTSVNIEMHRD